MSRKARYHSLLEKSIQAALSAIEVYNKPDFKYREESFSILMVNAWEVLLKAKILKDNNNKLKSIYVIDKDKTKADGTPYKSPKYKTNRAGNFLTIEITKAIKTLNLEERLAENILLLTEIRDNAIHFFNESKLFEKKVLEIGTASLKSYVECVNEWFDYDLSQYNFYLMPLSFYHPHEWESFSFNKEDKQHQNLLKYIAEKEKKFPSNTKTKHNISLILETKFVRSQSIKAIPVRYSTETDAVPVAIDSEEKFMNKYKWTYKDDLFPHLKKRYIDFKQDRRFFEIKRELEKDINYCGIRYLDFNNKTGTKKKFYDPNIITEFDKHYTKKP
jgi:hypothetical protein